MIQLSLRFMMHPELSRIRGKKWRKGEKSYFWCKKKMKKSPTMLTYCLDLVGAERKNRSASDKHDICYLMKESQSS